MKIYFAGSIRGGRDDQDLYMNIINLLSGYGTVLTEHVGDQTLSILGEDGPDDSFIYNRDMSWLEEADIVVAEVTSPSLGVGYEIGWAENKKPVICLYRQSSGRRLSAMISGNNHLKTHVYESIADLPAIFEVEMSTMQNNQDVLNL